MGSAAPTSAHLKRRRDKPLVIENISARQPNLMCAVGTGAANNEITIQNHLFTASPSFWLYLSGIAPSAPEENILRFVRSQLAAPFGIQTESNDTFRDSNLSEATNFDNQPYQETQPATADSSPPSPAPFSTSVLAHSATTNSNAQLMVYYQNAGGMRTKTNEFLLALSSCDYDVIMITETWLKNDIGNSELASNYKIYRNDRNANTSHLRRGGGVLIAVRHGIDVASVAIPGCDHLEQVVVRIKDRCRNVYFCCAYFRPNSETAMYASHMSALEFLTNMISSNDIIVLAGDYNLPNLLWTFDEDADGFLPVNASTEQELAVIESTIACGLSQMCSLANANGRILDLLFVNRPDLADILHPPNAILNTDRHHYPTVLLLDYFSDELADPVSSHRLNLDFMHCDTDRVMELLLNTNWQILFEGLNIDVAVSTFYDHLWDVLHIHTPPKRLPRHQPYKLPWWNSELRRSRNLVRKARKRYLRDRTDQNKSMLSRLEIAYSTLRNAVFNQYISNIERNVKQDPSTFWKYINSRRLTNCIPSSMTLQGRTSENIKESADLFADFFSSVYSPVTPDCNNVYFDTLPSYDIILPQPVFSEQEVLKVLNSLDPSKGSGPDGIPTSLVVKIAASLVTPLCMIFNRSISEGG
ncbi:uncharacterized protein LOC129742888 [Uranotaenia lowii]|uniref:uncharacterized protein LOC129742888 n=1 Tax=Uranotaenia lowii TaxID=190385 RepID=UPI00247ADE9B|nr:uncharacterized protein LOC129742888 [Uranotaenia lowii]